jgi:glutamate carboxypeptidase
VTPSVASSGTKTNVVPEHANLAVDVRVWSEQEATRVERKIRAHVPAGGATLVIEGGFDRPPLEPTPAAEALYARARAIAAELGFVLGAARVGGGSDGNLTAAAGVATLDGLGPNGRGAHARDECVFVSDLAPRAELLMRLIESLA